MLTAFFDRDGTIAKDYPDAVWTTVSEVELMPGAIESLRFLRKMGYEIIKEVEQQTNGKVKLKQPSLYSSLKRFEQKGYITSYWGDSDIGGRRHYYSITPTGKAYALNPKQKIQNEKILDDKIEDVVDIAEDDNLIQPYEFEIDETEDNDVYLQNKYSTFNVDEKMNELLFDDNQTNNALSAS